MLEYPSRAAADIADALMKKGKYMTRRIFIFEDNKDIAHLVELQLLG
jgi:hypothetical protein